MGREFLSPVNKIMDAAQIYVLISLVVLAAVAAISFMRMRRFPGKGLSFLASLAFIFVISGIVFGDNRTAGYSLIGLGVVFSLADMINSIRTKKAKDNAPKE